MSSSVDIGKTLPSKLTLSSVRKRTKATVITAIAAEDAILVQAPIASGKTTSVPKAVAETGQRVTYLTQREELYEQMEELCDAHELSVKRIPRSSDCPTFAGKHGREWRKTVEDLYGRGLLAADLHHELELPCSPGCPYMEDRNFDRDKYDVLVGYPKQAYAPPNVKDRVVVCDEYVGSAFELEIEDPRPIVHHFLDRYSKIPYSDYTDVIEHRDDEERHAKALAWFKEHGATRDVDEVLEVEDPTDVKADRHALAPYLTYALLTMHDLGNGFEVCPSVAPWDRGGINRERHAVRNRRHSQFYVLTPPDLSEATCVVGLDGTPTKPLWDLAYGEDFELRQVLGSTDERNAYIKNALQTEIKLEATDAVRHAGGGDIAPDQNAGLLMGVEAAEGRKPALITTKKALTACEDEGLLNHAGQVMNFGQVLSSNDFKHEYVGVVLHSPHPGDGEIKKWGAYMGETVERTGQGTDKDYGPVGNEIYRHFVHHKVLQAILRFGRDGKQTTVYINTQAIPEWFDPDATVTVETFKSQSRRDIARALQNRGNVGATKQELGEATNYSERTVRRSLHALQDEDYAEKEDRPGRYADQWKWIA